MAGSIIRGIHVPESISPEFRECYARLEEQALLMNYSSSASEHPVPLSSAYASVLELVARDPDEWPRLWPNIGPETRHLPLQGVLEWARDAETRIDGFHLDTAVFTQVASRYVPHPLDTSSVEITPGMQLVVDTFARETHERWLEGRLREGEAVTLGHWETLTVEQKAPSINQAVETVRAMSLLGIDFNDLRPLSGDESRKLIDGLTRNAHEVWAEDNLDRGVVYGVTRIRDENGRTLTHPDLVPYEDLSEKEKEYDKKVAQEAMDIVSEINIQNNMAQSENLKTPEGMRELTKDEMAQTVGGVEVSPFNDKLIGIAQDLAIEFTVGGDRFDRDDIALALYEAGLKAEQLPEFRDYIRDLPQCRFPEKERLDDLWYEVAEFEDLVEKQEIFSPFPTDWQTAENERLKRMLDGLKIAEQEHEQFIKEQLKAWLPDDVVEKGEILDKLISNSQENRLPFDGCYKVGNGLWAGFNMVWEDLGSNIIMDSNCKRLHEGEIFTLLQDSFPNSRMAPGYHVDDNGILTAVTGHMDDNGKIVSDGLFVLDTKTGKSRSFDAKECSAQLTKALEEAEKVGLGMEFTISACMDLWNGEAKDVGAAISAGLKEWDIAMPSDLYVSRSREDIIAEDRVFVNRIFSPEEMNGDLKIFCSDDLSTSVIKLWAGSSNGKDQDYFVVVDHREDKGLLVNGANYNNIRSCSHGVIQSLNTPDYYKGHEPYLSFFDPASRDTVKDLCSKVDKALGLCCDNIHQHVYFANISRAMERRSSEGEYLEIFSADRHAANFAPLFGEHRAEPVLDNMVYVDKFLTYSRFNGVLSGFTAEMTENGMKHGEPFMIDMDSLEVLYPDRSPGSIDGFSKEQTFAEEETQDNTVEI